MKHWKAIGTFACVMILLGFSVYALLDALAISRVYAVVETETAAQTEAAQAQTLSCRRTAEDTAEPQG